VPSKRTRYQRFVILNHTNCLGDVERGKVGLDGFEERRIERFKKGARLLQIWPVAEEE
jgi:hypothetical protein